MFIFILMGTLTNNYKTDTRARAHIANTYICHEPPRCGPVANLLQPEAAADL